MGDQLIVHTYMYECIHLCNHVFNYLLFYLHLFVTLSFPT